MEILLKVIHVVASVFLILVVLLQSGRGGGMGAAFGGASGQIFGGRGAGSFLSHLTSGAAVMFFLTSLTLSMMSSRHRSVVMHALPAKAPTTTESPSEKAADPGADTDKAATGTPADGAAVDEKIRANEGDAATKPPAQNPDAPSPTPPGVPSGSP